MSEYEERVTIVPSTRMLKGMINNGAMSLHRAVYELIDNSIDSLSRIKNGTNKRIELSYKNKEFQIQDNGAGSSDLMEMMRLGGDCNYERGSIGRYGWGFKDAVVWMGNYVIAESLTLRNEKRSISADWGNMIALNAWDFHRTRDTIRKTHGMTVLVQELRSKRFKGWGTLKKYITESFSAAIDSGIKILVDGEEIKSKPQPLLTDAVEGEGVFRGLGFKFIAGILAEPKSALSGWDIRYGVKTIATGYVKDGFGEYNAQGFYGRFQMLDDESTWELNKNKEDSEDLGDVLNCPQIQNAIRPILEKLKRKHRSVLIQLNTDKTNTFLTQLLSRTKARVDEEGEPVPESGGSKGGGGGGGGGKGGKKNPKKPGIPDATSKTERMIRIAKVLKVLPHMESEQRGFGFVTATKNGETIIVHIGQDTEYGEKVWQDNSGEPTLLTHLALMYLAVWFGLQIDVFAQLQLPIGDQGDKQEVRIAKNHLYLTGHAEDGKAIIEQTEAA